MATIDHTSSKTDRALPYPMRTDFENIPESGARNYLLRTTMQHHIHLSAMADQKANIMIAASSILLTGTFAGLNYAGLLWGFMALGVFALFSLILALLAVTPRFRPIDHPREFNPLFFGDFSKLSIEEYYDEMAQIMDSADTIYKAQARDIYNLGVMLQSHKFKYLAMSYRSCLVGVALASILFFVQTLINQFGG